MPVDEARNTAKPARPLFQGHKHKAPAPSIVNVMMSKNPPSLEEVFGPCWPLHLNDGEWNVLIIDLHFRRPIGDPGNPEEDFWIKIASTAYWSGLSMSAAVRMRWHEEYPASGEEDEEDEEEEDEGNEDVAEEVEGVAEDEDEDSEMDSNDELDNDSSTAVSTPSASSQ